MPLSPVMSGLLRGAGRPGGFQGVDTPVSPPSVTVVFPAVLSSTVRSVLHPPLEVKQNFSRQTTPPGAITQDARHPDTPLLIPSQDPGARVTVQSNELTIKREQDICP